jgi:hypothetical protein
MFDKMPANVFPVQEFFQLETAFSGTPRPLTFVPDWGSRHSFTLAYESVSSARDELIRLVNQGRLKPQDAEFEARQRGLEPFTVIPDPSAFDPMKEVTWSLLMALAWIMWRSAGAVREMWDLYRNEFRFWEPRDWQEGTGVVLHRNSLHCRGARDFFAVTPPGPVRKGQVLKTKDAPRLSDLSSPVASDPQIELAVRDHRQAFRLLRTEAERGTWLATGVPTTGGTRREISSFEWADVELREAGGDELVRVRGADASYGHCRFPVAGLLQSYPAAVVDGERATTAATSVASAAVSSRGERSRRSKGGRRPGSGSYEAEDAPLIERMRDLLDAGQVPSRHAAAGKFARDAFGPNTTEASKRRRLANRYRATYGSDV